MGNFFSGGLGAIAGVAGGLLSNSSSKRESQRNRNFEAHQAELNRQFQERMSNTAMQRMKSDYEKAGINPLLGIAGGGASTPSGGQGSGSQAPIGDPIEKGISSAIAAKQLQLATEKQKEDISLTKAQKKNTDADTVLKARGSARAELENEVTNSLIRPLLDAWKSSSKRQPKMDPSGQGPININSPKK